MPLQSPRITLERLREVPRALWKVHWLRWYVSKPNRKIREYVARLYLRGEGVEIGALHSPLSLPRAASARYVDRMSLEELRSQYPDLDLSGITAPEIIDDGERLASLSDETQDFVVANHFLEHCEDPIGALKNMLRVLKPGGIAYLAIPDKRFTFDVERPVTVIEHLKRDHDLGPAGSRDEHFKEWSGYVERAADEDLDRVAADLMGRDYSIHFHVWTQFELMELIVALRRDYQLPFDVELFLANDPECVVVLRKTPLDQETSS